MTREEAIEKLKSQRNVTCNGCLHSVGWCGSHCKFSEAIDMAIEALKQPEPCEDVVSRQAAIDALKHNQDVYSHNFHDDPIDKYTTAIIATDIDTLVNLPPIQPEVLACGNGELVAQPEPTDIDAREAVYNLAEKIGIHQLYALTVELRGEPIQPEPAIPLSWIEKEIEWLKSLDNTFSEITALQISAMVLKWRDEQDETD